MGDHV